MGGIARQARRQWRGLAPVPLISSAPQAAHR